MIDPEQPQVSGGPGCGAVLAWWLLVGIVAGIVAIVEVLF